MVKQTQSIEDFVGKAKRAKKVENVFGHLDTALSLGADKKYIASVYRELAGRTGTSQDVQLRYLAGASGLEGNKTVVEIQMPSSSPSFFEVAKAKGQELSDKLSDSEGRKEIKESVVEGTKKAYDATAQVTKKGYNAVAPVVQSWWGKAKEKAKTIVDKIDPPRTTLEEMRRNDAERDAVQKKNNQEAMNQGSSAYEKFQAKYGRRK